MKRSLKTHLASTIIASIVVGSGFFVLAHAQLIGVTLPSVPASVSATAGTAPGQINVSWSASAESSGTIEGYYVYRNGAQVATTAGTSYVDAGLQSGYYNYTVASYDGNGYQSQQSASVSVTLIADKTPPSTPANVTVSGATTTDSYYAQIPVTISWSASTDNVGVVGYYVYRNSMPITSSTSAFTGTSISDSVGPGTYTYTVVAYDAAQNNSSPSTPVSITIAIDSIPPSAPTAITAQQVSASGATVSWAPSTDAGGIAGYQVFRNGIQIASTSGSPYADTGLSTNVSYSYAVRAYDVAGNVSSPSQPLATVAIQPFSGPSAPIVTGAVVSGTSSVWLSWVAGADPLTITGYTIYRDGGTVATITSTTYMDAGLSPGAHFYNLSETDITSATSPLSASSTVIVPVASAAPSPSAAPATPNSIPTSVTVTAPPVVTSSGATTAASAITQSLYYGLRDAQVSALQSVLVNNGYLAPVDATGFFGTLTLGAVQKFQCAQAIVCTGGAGWGTVGPKTRTALNGLAGGTMSTSAMLAEIQTLEAELAALEAQLPAGK